MLIPVYLAAISTLGRLPGASNYMEPYLAPSGLATFGELLTPTFMNMMVPIVAVASGAKSQSSLLSASFDPFYSFLLSAYEDLVLFRTFSSPPIASNAPQEAVAVDATPACNACLAACTASQRHSAIGSCILRDCTTSCAL